MPKIREHLDSTFYPGVNKNWDDEIFRSIIAGCINGDSTVLDLGAGAGVVAEMDFRGAGKLVCGIDLDPRVLENKFLDEAHVSDAIDIPYPDGTFDVVFADNVMEHIEQPQMVFSEVARVLKPGGCFLFKTPNRRHYMPLIARLSPLWFHKFVNRLRGRDASDTFPTLYRVNRPAEIRKLGAASGFDVRAISLFEGRPEYLRLMSLAYVLGIAYERLVNSVSYLADFKILLIAVLVKKEDAEESPDVFRNA